MQPKGIFDPFNWIKIKWIFGEFSVTEIFIGERGDEVKWAFFKNYSNFL